MAGDPPDLYESVPANLIGDRIPRARCVRIRESVIPTGVMEIDDDETGDILPVPLDSATIRWLAFLERTTGAPAAQLVAAMIHDIRVDDEAAHQLH